MDIKLHPHHEEQILAGDWHDVIYALGLQTGNPEGAKKFVYDMAVDLGMLTRNAVKRHMGRCEVLPIRPGQKVTIKKGTIVRSLGPAGIHPAARTYTVVAHSVDNGVHRHRNYHNELVDTVNPKIVWVGSGGYWCDVDINDVPEATP